MARGSIALVLHAHLPFVRHPESTTSLEERWLFEAITETYLPLLDVLEALEHDRLDVRLTVSISPTLLAMLTDRLLRARYLAHLDALVQLSEREERRTRPEPHWHRCAELYLRRLTRARSRLLDHWHQDVAGAFRAFQERGRVELFTTAATHAVLPLLATTPECGPGPDRDRHGGVSPVLRPPVRGVLAPRVRLRPRARRRARPRRRRAGSSSTRTA